jgi:ABC-2 type transport system ATP-binding protein
MYFFEANNIVKAYENHIALNDVTLKVKQASIFGLLGPNGAGKTTMIRIINQIIAPDKGHVLWDGKPLTQEYTQNIGYLPEERGLYKKMKVYEHGIYLARLKGLSKHEAEKRLNYWFKKFDISNWKNKKIEELSKGMQQKVQFILTVIHEPKMLILDEPFSGFDPINTEIIKQNILEYKSKGTSIILSTHNMASVEELCDDMMLLNKSKAILEGNVEEIKNKFKNNIVEIHISECKVDIQKILPSEFKLLSHNESSGISKIQIQYPLSTSPNDVLNIILPHCNVHTFFEIIPSLNDIFIQQVQASSNI